MNIACLFTFELYHVDFLIIISYHVLNFDAIVVFSSYMPQNSLSVSQLCEIWETLSSFSCHPII